MNRFQIPRSVRRACFLLLLAPALALAQNPYEGVYIGTYNGTGDDGEFALIVNDQGYGRMAAFDSVDNAGYIEENIRVGSDGSFQFLTREGTHVNGQATAVRVTGQYSKGSRQGSFSGQRTPVDGPLKDVAGFYSGPVTMTDSDSDIELHSHLVAFVASDGTAFILLKRGYRDGADVFPDGLELDLDFEFDSGSSFPFGPGPVPWFPFEPGTGSTFPFDPGFGSWFDFGSWLGFGSSFNWGSGFSTSLDIGPFLGFNGWYRFGTGHCGLGWPFNFGVTFSISVSLFGSVDIEFSTDRSDCSSFASGPGFRLPVGVSGGVVQIGSDGVIQAALPGGLLLQGVLDRETGMAAGNLSYQDHATSWSGNWSIDRYGAGGGNSIAKLLGPLTDFNDDGFKDVLWQDQVSGENVAWLMDGPDTLAEVTLEYPAGDMEWELVAVRELDGDQVPDFIWRHAVSAEILVEFGGDIDPLHLDLDPVWQIVGSGAFLTGPRPELLLRNRGTGATAIITDLAGQPELVFGPGMKNPDWVSVALADFDGNGYTDILWARQSSRNLRIWLMDGFKVIRNMRVSTMGRRRFDLAGVGDFDGDGSADLLWRKPTNGRLEVTLNPAAEITETVILVKRKARQWQAAAVGDLDGDGTDDLIWRHILRGRNVAWLIADAQVAETASLRRMPGLFWEVRY